MTNEMVALREPFEKAFNGGQLRDMTEFVIVTYQPVDEVGDG